MLQALTSSPALIPAMAVEVVEGREQSSEFKILNALSKPGSVSA